MALVILSCARLTKEQARLWLDSINGEPKIDMTGQWDAGGMFSGGWGVSNFIQEGKDFSGSLGMYNVDGAVVGEQVYMSLSSGRRVYYTARLKK